MLRKHFKRKESFLNKDIQVLKAVFIRELSFKTILIVIFYRFLNYRIGFLKINNFNISDKSLDLLDSVGVFHLSHHRYAIENPYNTMLLADKVTKKYVLSIYNNNLFKNFVEKIDQENINSKNIEILLYDCFYSKVLEYIELIEFRKYCIKNKIFSKINIVSLDSNLLVGLDEQCEVDCKLQKLFLVINYLIFFVKYSYKIIVYFIFNKWVNTLGCIKNNIQKERRYTVNKFDEYAIAYFPHKGIFYGEHFVKDQYYSESKESPLNSSNILHLTIGETLDSKTLKYFNQNKIPHTDFESLTKYNYCIYYQVMSFVLKSILNYRLAYKEFHELLIFAGLYFSVLLNFKRLNRLKGLSIVLIGYDVLFPKAVSYCCKQMGVKTIATQERFIHPWVPGMSMIIDDYYVHGDTVSKQIDNNQLYNVNNLISIGPIRLDLIYKHIQDICREKEYLFNNDEKYIAFVSDYHSSKTKYGNGRSLGNNWRNNLIFYKAILKIAKKYAEIKFVIKGKNHEFLNIEYFKEIVTELNSQNNIEIIKDYEYWTPEKIAAVCDFSIALHTSLGDEILAMRKPVIFFDYYGIPSTFYDYDGYPVIAKNIEQIEHKIDMIVSNEFMTDDQFKMLAKKFYSSSCHGKVRQTLTKHLQETCSELL